VVDNDLQIALQQATAADEAVLGYTHGYSKAVRRYQACGTTVIRDTPNVLTYASSDPEDANYRKGAQHREIAPQAT